MLFIVYPLKFELSPHRTTTLRSDTSMIFISIHSPIFGTCGVFGLFAINQFSSSKAKYTIDGAK